jgi:hypothetical protein
MGILRYCRDRAALYHPGDRLTLGVIELRGLAWRFASSRPSGPRALNRITLSRTRSEARPRRSWPPRCALLRQEIAAKSEADGPVGRPLSSSPSREAAAHQNPGAMVTEPTWNGAADGRTRGSTARPPALVEREVAADEPSGARDSQGNDLTAALGEAHLAARG